VILSHQAIRARGPFAGEAGMIEPMMEQQLHEPSGLTFGLGPCGYDIRVRQAVTLTNGGFRLASSVERFIMPNDLCAHVRDKSSLIRQGLLVGNTVIEPGWQGYLTLELFYAGAGALYLVAGQPIAQVQFTMLDQATAMPYAGRYQNQPDAPVQTIRHHEESPAEYIRRRARLP
jgi:dCTP deaminase